MFCVSAGLGFAVASRLDSGMLRLELEQRLGEALGTEVRVGSVSLSLGLALEVVGHRVEALPGPDGPALDVERAVVELRPFAHLTGQRRLARVTLDGSRLRVRPEWIEGDAKGVRAALRAEGGGARPRGNPDELLGPLIVLEATARHLLESALPASRIELRNAVIELEGRKRGRRPVLTWNVADASVARRVLLGETRLDLSARLSDARGERGEVELRGELSRGGALHLGLAATDLDLAAVSSWPPRARVGLSGRLSGTALFDAPSPGTGRLELDLVGHDLSGAGAVTQRWLGPLGGARAELGAVVEIDPEHVRVERAHVAGDRIALRIEGEVERPFSRASLAKLSLALGEAPLEEVRQLLAWVPEVGREAAHAVLASLESGQLRRLEVGGSAALGDWLEFLSGRSRRAPDGFTLLADLDEFRLRSGDDRLDDVGGHLSWTGDRVAVRDAHAVLDGRPLPRLDLEVEGITAFFANDPALRRLRHGAPPLAGLGAMWQDLSPDHDEGGPPVRTALELDIERLEHPMFLWPIDGLAARITPLEQGVHVAAQDGRWGGVPIALEADWLFEPEERVVARVRAGGGADLPILTSGDAPALAEAPTAAASPASEGGAGGPAGSAVEPAAEPDASDGAWARGSVALGAVDTPRWKQRSARARFELRGARLRLSNGRIELAPYGRADASLLVDLSHPEAAPFLLSFEIFDGDLPSVGTSVKLPHEIAAGHVDAAGSLEGSFDPAAPLSASLSGMIDVDARDGRLRKDVPAVMAILLANDVLAPLASREWVRFDRMQSLLELDHGKLRSDSLTLDGPDARAFLSGDVGIGEPPHALDVQLVLFLFRNVDRVLDKIPLVNFLLLGPNKNLLAAHYALTGSLEEPRASLVPLDTLTAGPGTLVFEGLPSIVSRGLSALGGLLGRDHVAEQAPGSPPQQPAPPPPRES